MTREEAISDIRDNIKPVVGGISLDMAIEALEIVSCIKEKCAYCPHCENCDVDDETLEIKALEQEPCEDVISRDCDKCAYYVDGANDEACDGCFADEYEHPNFKPKAQHCDDCISRQEAINCVTSNEFRYKIVEDMKTLPSVTPKEKTRHKVKEEAKEQTPMEQTLDFFKNLYLQNKEEVDRVARDFKAESEVQK